MPVCAVLLCFISSVLHPAFAADVAVSPMIVPPDEIVSLNRQMVLLEEKNRGKAAKIQQLIRQNPGLTQWWGNSRYGDLVHLTEDADAQTEDKAILAHKEQLLSERLQMLNVLEGEMIALSHKLDAMHKPQPAAKPQVIVKTIPSPPVARPAPPVVQTSKPGTVSADVSKLLGPEQKKIKTLMDRLARMEQKIDGLNGTIGRKDVQIRQLQDQVADGQKQINSREDQIRRINQQVSEKQQQVDLLKSELQNQLASSEETGRLRRQLAEKRSEVDSLKSKLLEDAAQLSQDKERISRLNLRLKEQSSHEQLMKDRGYRVAKLAQKQQAQLKADQSTIRRLNQVAALAKNKAKYEELTSRQDHADMGRLQDELAPLKAQLDRMTGQLSEKQGQIGLLKSELEDKITEINQQAQRQKDLEGRISQMAAEQGRWAANWGLARQLMDLYQKQEMLSSEKSRLILRQYAIFEDNFRDFQQRISGLLASRRLYELDLRDQLEAFKNELGRQRREALVLRQQLQDSLAAQNQQQQIQKAIDDIKTELQNRQSETGLERRRAGMREDLLRRRVSGDQEKIDLLKQELENKITEARGMTAMLKDYQGKLESQNTAYNDQMKEMLSLKAGQKQAEKEMETRDLDLSTIQQKTMDAKVLQYKNTIRQLQALNSQQSGEIRDLKADLALARQQLSGMPSADEINAMKTDLAQALDQVKRKDQALVQTKAMADEYKKEFQAQSSEFQSLEQQLHKATDELGLRKEDLHYKNLEIIRLKERSAMAQGNLQDRIKDLTRQLKLARKGKAAARAPVTARPKDVLTQKLEQALNKIDQQGNVISVLAQKLEACGQTVDVRKQSKDIKLCGYTPCPNP